jgi:hypothetical protein
VSKGNRQNGSDLLTVFLFPVGWPQEALGATSSRKAKISENCLETEAATRP